ncbi:MAG: P-type conjugative transfer protein TrbL [Rhizobiaceae bacterium]
MDDLNVIDQFTQTFSTYIETGFGLLSGDVGFLVSVLVGIDIVLAGLFWALMGEDNVLAQLIKKVLYIGFFALLLNNFSSLANIIFESFTGLGLKASGVPFGADQLMRPGFVADTGFTAAWPLLEAAGELIGFTSFFENFVTIVVLLLAWLIVLLAFFVLSVQLFITIIEFKLTTLAGFVLVPFALFGKTSFLAERVLGNIITSGIKLMVLAIVVGIGSTIFGDIATLPSGEIDLRHAASIILAAIAVFGLAIFVPGIAAGLVSGAPQLGAGAAAGTAAGLIGVGVAGGALASGSVRAIGSASGSAITSAASLTGRVSAGYESGGISGVAKATVDRATSNTVSRMSAPVRDAHAQGAAEGYRATGSSSSATASSTGRGASVVGSSDSQTPPWAKQMHSSQRIREAGMIATHTLRDGDRGGAGEGPKLDPDK